MWTMPGVPREMNQHSSLWYWVTDDVGWIEFPPEILQHFEQNKQVSTRDREAGGQLFWTWTPEGRRRVSAITGPRPTDRRSRRRYKADHYQEKIEIDEKYQDGHYFLGDWHTHPESIARPSETDRQVIKEIYQNSRNLESGLLLVIVGTAPVAQSMSVLWCDGEISYLMGCS